MKIIIINGSPRKSGTTAKILEEIELELSKKKDVSVEFVNISDLKITSCSGCCSCYKSGKCYMNDDAEKLSRKIYYADGIVIGSPTYASNVSGQLKTFIDRGHFVVEQLLLGKYAIGVATGENYGNSDTGKVIVKLLKYSGAKLSGKIICNVPFGSNPMKISSVVYKIQKISNTMYNDIVKQKSYPIQTFVHKVIFSFGIKPFVIKKGESYKGVVLKWERLGILQKTK